VTVVEPEGGWPHECPHCGAGFGWGPDVALLAVFTSAPFDEPAPCCGERITGTINRDGDIE
jgi:hypothetical protein